MNMKDLLNTIYTNLETFILGIGYFGPVVASLIIIIISIIPFLPLFLFIALNCMILGKGIGLLISYIFTIVGCLIAYTLVNKFLKDPFTHFLEKRKNGKKVLEFVNQTNMVSLTIIMAIPFAPAFLINIAAGLSENITKKIFLISLLIGKSFMVYFWGYIGASLKDCLTNPYIFIRIVLMVLVAYVVSTILNKKLGLK